MGAQIIQIYLFHVVWTISLIVSDSRLKASVLGWVCCCYDCLLYIWLILLWKMNQKKNVLLRLRSVSGWVVVHSFWRMHTRAPKSHSKWWSGISPNNSTSFLNCFIWDQILCSKLCCKCHKQSILKISLQFDLYFSFWLNCWYTVNTHPVSWRKKEKFDLHHSIAVLFSNQSIMHAAEVSYSKIN